MPLGQFDGEVRAETVLVLQSRESMVVHELRRTRQKFDVLLPAHSRILARRKAHGSEDRLPEIFNGSVGRILGKDLSRPAFRRN